MAVAIWHWLAREEGPEGDGAAPPLATGASIPGGVPLATADELATPSHPRQALEPRADSDPADSSPAAHASLRVHVRGADGAAIAAVRVGVAPAKGFTFEGDAIRAPSDARGIAEFPSLAPGTWLVHAHGARLRRVTLLPGEPASVEIELAPGIRVSGRVVDGEGLAIADAELVLVDPRDAALQSIATSDPAGRFAFEVHEDLASCFARKAGHASSATNMRLGFGAELLGLELVVERADAELHGVVLDAANRGIEGVELVARLRAPRGTSTDAVRRDRPALRWPRTRSAADGRFSFRGLLAGELELSAVHPDFAPATRLVPIEPYAGNRLELSLDAGSSLRGVVRDDAGARLGAATIEVGMPPPHGARRARADAQGEFVVHGLGTGSVTLWAEHPDAVRASLSVEIDGEPAAKPIEVVLPSKTRLHGLVLDERGAPLADLVVLASPKDGMGASTVSGPDGRFAFGVGHGLVHELSVYVAESDALVPLVTLAGARADAGEHRLVVPESRRPSATVRARLTLPAGYDEDRLRVALHDPEEKLVQIRGVAGSGELELGPLAPGTYVLSTLGVGSRFHGDELARFTLAPDQTLDLGTIAIPAPVVPELRARTSKGRVIDALDGHLLALADRRDCGPLGLRNGETHWRPPLRPGEYTLQIDDGAGFAGRELQISLRAGPPNRLDVVLDARSRVIVTPRAADGLTLPDGLEFELLHQDGVRSVRSWDGSPLRFSLPDGRHRLAVRHDRLDGAIEIRADAQQAEPLELVLTVTARR
ncbi:MAG: carboxypeptidase regulatory-like domain-containing protein [Planctomycetes bacterium]|nr:carboxypeptidase regulatory-like domain-containing protein [Planctomycetota bacterium]